MKPDTIDNKKCIFCKMCLNQCSNPIFDVKEDERKIIISEKKCISCGHCIAICPAGALSLAGRIPEEVKKFPEPDDFLLMLRSRRSMRKYENKGVSDEILEKILDFIRYAPTGSNSQATKVIFIKNEEIKKELTKILMKLYIFLNSITNFFLIKYIFYLLLGREKAKSLKNALSNMVKKYKSNEDPLFFNAPVICFLYTYKNETQTPKDDCCYALYNAVLGAESMGLSSCINQLAVISYNFKKRKIKKLLSLPPKSKIYACATFGYPAYNYKRVVFRNETFYQIL